MSNATDPLPPTPHHTPPVDKTPGRLERFSRQWAQWFDQARDKINVINSSLVSLGIVSEPGFLSKQADGSWASREIQGTADRITVLNGDGDGGNPTIDFEDDAIIALIDEHGGGGGGGGGGPGSVIGYAYTHSTTVASTSSTTFAATSNPTNTQGVAYNALNTTYIPTDADSQLEIEVFFPIVSGDSTAVAIQMGIFRDGGTNPIATGRVNITGANYNHPLHMKVVVDAGSTSPTTFSLRWGVSHGTGYILSAPSVSPFFGGNNKALMTVREYMAYPSGSNAIFLDTLTPTPRAVIWLDKRISTATNCIRVRRSSDNTEQDIGFSGTTVGSGLDTTALLAFVGSGSGYLVTGYDQTGNGENATQSDTAKQPRIVNVGVYDEKAVFDGINDCLPISVLTLGTPYVSIYMKAALVGPYAMPNYATVFELASDLVTVGSGCFGFWFDGSVGRWNALSNTGGSGASSTRGRQMTAPWTTAMSLYSFVYNTTISGATEIQTSIDRSIQTVASESPGSEQSGNYRSDQNLNIGARNNGASNACRMDLKGIVIYNADTSTIHNTIENSLR